MQASSRQFLLMTAWLFARHGQTTRARVLCEALAEDDARDGVTAAALAELYLAEGNPAQALDVLTKARCPRMLERAEAILETRALKALGRSVAADRRWKRYLNAAKGAARTWAS